VITPKVALSIRQPWVWLILHAGKDIENRTWFTRFSGPCYIHASQTMTRADYEAAALFCSGLDAEIKNFPAFDSAELKRGGIVGQVHIRRCVQRDPSQWFCGPYGLILDNPQPLDFIPCKGSLKFFPPDIGGGHE